MLPNITNAQNKIAGKLVLKLEIPVLDHPGGTPRRCRVAWRGASKRFQCGILSRRGVWRKTSTKRRLRSKVIRAYEVRVDGKPSGEIVAEIGIGEGRIIDAISATHHGVFHKVGRIGKSNAWTKIFEVSVCAGGTLAKDQSPRLSWRERIRGCQRQNRLRACGFMARSVHVPSKPQVQRQVTTELEVILHISGVVVLVPARVVRESRHLIVVRK